MGCNSSTLECPTFIDLNITNGVKSEVISEFKSEVISEFKATPKILLDIDDKLQIIYKKLYAEILKVKNLSDFKCIFNETELNISPCLLIHNIPEIKIKTIYGNNDIIITKALTNNNTLIEFYLNAYPKFSEPTFINIIIESYIFFIKNFYFSNEKKICDQDGKYLFEPLNIDFNIKFNVNLNIKFKIGYFQSIWIEDPDSYDNIDSDNVPNIIITQKTYESNINNIFVYYSPNKQAKYNGILLYDIIKTISIIHHNTILSFRYIPILKFLNDNYKETLKNKIYLIKKNKKLLYIPNEDFLDSDNIIDFDFVFSNIDVNIINKYILICLTYFIKIISNNKISNKNKLDIIFYNSNTDLMKKIFNEIVKFNISCNLTKNSNNTHTFVFDFKNESISNTFERLSRYGSTESIGSIGSAIELLDKKNQ